MWRDQAERLGSWKQHTFGYRSFIQFKYYVDVNVNTRHMSQIHGWCYIDLINMLCKPEYCRGSQLPQVSGFK